MVRDKSFMHQCAYFPDFDVQTVATFMNRGPFKTRNFTIRQRTSRSHVNIPDFFILTNRVNRSIAGQFFQNTTMTRIQMIQQFDFAHQITNSNQARRQYIRMPERVKQELMLDLPKEKEFGITREKCVFRAVEDRESRDNNRISHEESKVGL